ncbi:MAG: class I SAM-dependent methyltransferase [Deltaproteobacteria bacterium]|nr:class I SAM-dependent methyltransferase [Deltaproteobacteria bacterium]
MAAPDFPWSRYLAAKAGLDDRSLNQQVWQRLRREAASRGRPLAVLELGAGVGTMVPRLLTWGLPLPWRYTLLERDPALVSRARELLPPALAAGGLAGEWESPERFLCPGPSGRTEFRFLSRDFFAPELPGEGPWDIIIAHAFLDLLDLADAVRRLTRLSRAGALWWLTLLPDGITAFLPAEDPAEDAAVEAAYHASMDLDPAVVPGRGGSRTGRRLLELLPRAGAKLLAAGASDWVVTPPYDPGEEFFLACMLGFHEASLTGRGLDQARLGPWLARRRAQLRTGRLSLLVHQLDILALWPGESG